MILALIAAACLAQPRVEPPPVAPLQGPVVSPRLDRPTLVHVDFNGRIRRPETSPEHAAVTLMRLPADLQAAADAVFARRADRLDHFVSENLLLLSQLDTAGKSGDKLDQLSLLFQGFQKLAPILEEGPLREQVAAALPQPEAARFRALVNEYWSAIIAEGVRDSAAAGKHEARWQIDLAQRFEHLGKEIERSFERQTASGTLFVDYFMSQLDLSPQQQATIEQLKLDMLSRTDFRPSEKDQQLLALGALAYLNQQQREIVIQRLKGFR